MQSTPSAPGGADPHEVLAELGRRLDRVVEEAGPGSWTLDTPAAGWDIRTQIAHLTWTDEVSLAAISDADAFARHVEGALEDPEGFVDAGATGIAAADRDEILSRWRSARAELGCALVAADPGEPIPWFGPPMRPKTMATARIMETWAHGLDVGDALGTDLLADPAFRAAEPHVAKIGYRTRGFAYVMRQLEPPTSEVRVALTGTDGAVHEFGPEGAEQTVTGPLADFCLLVTQRVHRDDTALETVGEDAARWLTIAQAFAGTPGPGREKGARS